MHKKWQVEPKEKQKDFWDRQYQLYILSGTWLLYGNDDGNHDRQDDGDNDRDGERENDGDDDGNKDGYHDGYHDGMRH